MNAGTVPLPASVAPLAMASTAASCPSTSSVPSVTSRFATTAVPLISNRPLPSFRRLELALPLTFPSSTSVPPTFAASVIFPMVRLPASVSALRLPTIQVELRAGLTGAKIVFALLTGPALVRPLVMTSDGLRSV